jgi:hypothetical protein
MKKWMLLLMLGASVAIAEDNPPPVEPELDPVVQAAIEAALAEPPPLVDGVPVLIALPGGAPATGPASAPATTEAAGTAPATTQPTTLAATLANLVNAVATTLPATGAAIGTPSGRPNYSPRDGGRSSRTVAASFPRTVAMAKPLPKEYALVVDRSIFIKGMQRTPERIIPDRTDPRPPDTRPVYVPPPPRPEKTLLFNGATDADGQWVALFEDTSVSKVLVFKVGEKVARGKVAAMTLGTLDYDSNGKVKRILMGQNLDGEVVAVSTTRPALASTTPTTGPSAGPDGTGGATGGLPSGGGSILEQMRLRRLQGK